jgi:transcriptional regulator with XRE-family HTH domain
MTKLDVRRTSVATRRKANLQLRRYRVEAGFSQRRLAQLAGLSPGVVQLAEKGFTPYPGNAQAILDVLEAALGEPVRYIDVWRQPGQERPR